MPSMDILWVRPSQRPDHYTFDIQINTRSSHPEERANKIQILRSHSNGENDCEVAAERILDGTQEDVSWKPVVQDAGAAYYLLRVFHNCDEKLEQKPKMIGSTISAPVWIEV